MPLSNGERYVGSAIESIFNQDFADFELVISDNQSTDSSLAIVNSFGREDDRVPVQTSDSNHGAAWNFDRVWRV